MGGTIPPYSAPFLLYKYTTENTRLKDLSKRINYSTFKMDSNSYRRDFFIVAAL